MPDDQTVIDAIDLAERILRETVGVDQDWRSIERMARSLAALAARAQEPPENTDAEAGRFW